MEQRKEYVNSGMPTREVIPPERAEEAGIAFSEGRESLSQLITFCAKNGIRTWTACAGHYINDGKYYSAGQIGFALDDEKTIENVLQLFSSEVSEKNDVSLKIQRNIVLEERNIRQCIYNYTQRKRG